ncbi:hypothetical protein T484DRAFT_1807307 [Baffinella frigidus]|nr:hypothetical protein T484DRAFT_1807307 [Cryptophyta sp. CCMP2293]
MALLCDETPPVQPWVIIVAVVGSLAIVAVIARIGGRLAETPPVQPWVVIVAVVGSLAIVTVITSFYLD